MHRIDTTNAVPNLFGAGKSGFGSGNPATNQPATFLDDEWCNALQEEFAAIVEEKFPLDKSDRGQALKALKSIFLKNDQMIDRTGLTETLLLDRFDVIHKYRTDRSITGNGNFPSINATTGLVQGGVYKVWCNTAASGVFGDVLISLRPNNTTYANQFRCPNMNFVSTTTQPAQAGVIGPLGNFLFDNFSGADGTEGAFEMTVFTNVSNSSWKKVLYQGGDTSSSCVGTGVWENGSTVWATLGGFGFYGQQPNGAGNFSIDMYVRRLA